MKTTRWLVPSFSTTLSSVSSLWNDFLCRQWHPK